MLSLPDQRIWDSWIADDVERYHLLFMQALRSLVDPGARHAAAGVNSFDIVDPRPVLRQGNTLLASSDHVSMGETLCASSR